MMAGEAILLRQPDDRERNLESRPFGGMECFISNIILPRRRRVHAV